MAITVIPEQVCTSIAEVLRAQYERIDDAHRFTIDGNTPELTFTLTTAFFSAVTERLGGSAQAVGDTSFGGPKFFEVLVSEESRFGASRLFREQETLEKSDEENGVTYKLGQPSDDFIVFFLGRLADRAPAAAIRSIASRYRVRRMLQDDNGSIDILKLVRAAYGRMFTCRVEAATTRSIQDLSNHANAYLFQLTYNLNIALVETRTLDDFVRTGRLASMRRSRPSEIEPPKRTYLKDLTYHLPWT